MKIQVTKINKIIRSNTFLFLENHETRKIRIYFRTYELSNIYCKTRSIISKNKTLKEILVFVGDILIKHIVILLFVT